MKQSLLWGVIIVSIAFNPSESNAQRHTLRILTYNIYHGETTAGKVDMDVFGAIIEEVKPDLVALQEVDKNTKRTGGVDMTEELSKRTGLKGYFVKHRDFQGGEYGNAILSRFPVEGIDVIDAASFSNPSSGSGAAPQGAKTNAGGATAGRITIPCAKVLVPGAGEVIFAGAHLSTRLEDRKQQARQLMDYSMAAGAPMIITGDLNAEPHHEEIKMLFERFTEADTTFRNTFSTRTGLTKKIDYILFPSTGEWQVTETKVICRDDASDHCALFAILQFTPR